MLEKNQIEEKQSDIEQLRIAVKNVRQQPMECLDTVDFVNGFIMRQIDTFHAVEICEKDINDANFALSVIDNYAQSSIDRERFIADLKDVSQRFNQNSADFEKPVADTVSFVMRTMVPFVICISLFNIFFITYMSKTISSSIRNTIKLLRRTDDTQILFEQIEKRTTGELKTLLKVAKKRIANEMLTAQINQKLELLVEERTNSLLRANEELAQFAYRASHDLKAPLTSSKMLTQFIVEDIENGNYANAIIDTNKIHDQMERLETLVIGILSLTSADAENSSFSDISLSAVIESIQQRLFGPENISANFIQLADDMTHPLFSDEVRIMQILENLISNAWKYRDESKDSAPFVRVSASNLLNEYQVVVKDNGIGIPNDRKDEIFQMFKRFHSKVSSGSGLGLAIVKKHVDILKGTIVVDSSPRGTSFVITLPKQV
jgi:signal transduction histidine kinase